MKSIQARLTITFIGLMTALLVVIWGVNRWYLEDFYVDQKVESLMDAYDAVDRQIEENAAVGISVGQAMERRRDSSGNIVEGNLQKLIRDYSDSANVSVLMIDNSSADATVYSTSRDTQFLKDRIDRYIFGWNQSQSELVEEKENYTIQKTFDTRRNSMYLESWGFFSDNSTAFIMSTPLSSIGESVELSNQFLAYVGIVAVIVGAVMVYFFARQITKPINKLSALSLQMSQLDFDIHYEPGRHDMSEIEILGNSMNTLSERLKETVDELKLANDQLTKDIEEKTKIDEMRKEFIANVSHELKTPIALIQGYAEGLTEGMCEDEESRNYYCGVIMDEAVKMNRMVKQLLNLTALEFGNDTPVMETFNLTDVIRGIITSSSILIQQKEAQVIFEHQDPLPVVADEFKIEEVITNYLTNALNHANGEKKIEIRAEELETQVKVTVFNTGDPIPEEDIPKLWTKFYKVDKARTRAYGGSGIGLSIVKAIMESHHQEYGARNVEGGVEFWFTLEKGKEEQE